MTQKILFLTDTFRFFLAYIIGTFIFIRTYSCWNTLLGVITTILIVLIDLWFTTRRYLVGEQRRKWLDMVGILYKIAIITLLLVYTVTIWQSTHIWLYSAFGVFVACIFTLDFVLLKNKRS